MCLQDNVGGGRGGGEEGAWKMWGGGWRGGLGGLENVGGFGGGGWK